MRHMHHAVGVPWFSSTSSQFTVVLSENRWSGWVVSLASNEQLHEFDICIPTIVQRKQTLSQYSVALSSLKFTFLHGRRLLCRFSFVCFVFDRVKQSSHVLSHSVNNKFFGTSKFNLLRWFIDLLQHNSVANGITSEQYNNQSGCLNEPNKCWNQFEPLALLSDKTWQLISKISLKFLFQFLLLVSFFLFGCY